MQGCLTTLLSRSCNCPAGGTSQTGKGLVSSLRALGNRMINRVKIQLGRIADSIQRLTTGTPLEGATVRPRRSRDRDRVAFRVASPTGSPLFGCYGGILLVGLESWTDESLDRRLYESSDPLVRRHLNKPEGAHPGICTQGDDQDECAHLLPQISEHADDRLKGCWICRAILVDINGWLIGLSNINQRGSAICGDRSGDSLKEFTYLLERHLQVQDELACLRAGLAIHRQSHRFSCN
jgi:hypothetical protein